jgi:CRISPR-associated protein Cst1
MNDHPKYKQVLMVRRNWPAIRQLLRQISRRETDNNRKPLLSLDQFLSIFEMGEEAEYVDWALAWDLVLIRLMEVLYERNFFNEEMSEEDRQDLESVEAAILATVN